MFLKLYKAIKQEYNAKSGQAPHNVWNNPGRNLLETAEVDKKEVFEV